MKSLACSIGVYAQSAPYFRHSNLYGSSLWSTMGATCSFGLPMDLKKFHDAATLAGVIVDADIAAADCAAGLDSF